MWMGRGHTYGGHVRGALRGRDGMESGFNLSNLTRVTRCCGVHKNPSSPSVVSLPRALALEPSNQRHSHLLPQQMSPRSPTLQGYVPGRQSTLTSHRCRQARKCRWVVVDCCPSTMMSTGCDSLIRDPRNSSLRVVYPMRPRRLRRVWLVARASFFFFLRGISPPRSRVATERVESSLRLCGRSRRFGQYQYCTHRPAVGRPTHRPAGIREPLSAPCVRQLGWVGRLDSWDPFLMTL